MSDQKEAREITILKFEEITEGERNEIMKALSQINRRRKRSGIEPVKYELKELLTVKAIRSK